mgnify:CR=1 FL=1
MSYCEVIQPKTMSDSEMMEIIREKICDGWALADYKLDVEGSKVWVFEKE